MSTEHLITEHLDLWTSAVTHNNGKGRGNNSEPKLTGIHMLRELILELAVRGKLVPQDAEDEPAAKLLEQIEEEKDRLYRDGKTKKPKELPKIYEDEKPFGLPSNWEWTRLGHFTNYGSTEKAEPGSVSPETWVLELEDIEKNSSRIVQELPCHERQFRSSKNAFRKGDVLYGKLRPYLDKVLVAPRPGVCTTEIIPFRGFAGVSSYYIRWAMKSPFFKEFASDSTHGMNLPRLGTEKAKNALLPLPPLNEQDRIVEKVDELMALCDRLEQQTRDHLSAHETLVDTLLDTLTRSQDAAELAENWARLAAHFDTLFTTEHSIDRLEQTMLQLAAMGYLCPQNPDDEPAVVLANAMANEKNRLAADGFIKKPRQLPEIGKDEPPHAAPKGWEWVRLGDILRVINGRAYKKNEMLNEGTPLLRVGNLFTSNEWYYSDLDLEEDKYIENGDLIYAWSASFGPFIWNNGKVIYHYHIWKLDLYNDELISKEYLYYYLKVVTDRIKHDGSGIAMIHTTKSKMEELIVPLPPLNEQIRIVQKLNELLALCQNLKDRLNEAKITQRNLAAAIVKEAVA